MDEKRTIRVLHQGDPSRQLSRHEAVLYLATRELPERAILTGAPTEYLELYQGSGEEQQRGMRMGNGHLSVACGHIVHHEAAAPGSVRFPAWDGWEAIFGLDITITAFDPEANVVTGGGDIALSMGGRPRSVDEAMAFMRVMAVATGIASDAQIYVYQHHVVTN
jgi:hypothetical protein